MSFKNKSIDKNATQYVKNNNNNNNNQNISKNKFLLLDDDSENETCEEISHDIDKNKNNENGFITAKKKSKFDNFETFGGNDKHANTNSSFEKKTQGFSKFAKDGKKSNFSVSENEDVPQFKKSSFGSNLSQFDSTNDENQWKEINVKKQKFKKDFEIENYEEKQVIYEDENFDDDSNDKQLYIETKTLSQDVGNNIFLHCPWTVWTHKESCTDWTEKSYTNVYEIDSIGKFWRFFNNFHLFDKRENQFFIMRKKIKPIWEDNENRKGGIYSIRFDSYSKPGRIDVGTEFMISICLLIMNESFLLNNEEINGISYAAKSRSVFIKIWHKNASTKMEDLIPRSLIMKYDQVLRSLDRSHYSKKSENKLTTKCYEIRPNDE